MGLGAYEAKRDFTRTKEPRGSAKGSAKRAKGSSFVIQKHAARRLHYDLRLELDGTLKSWAVTRGPSLVPGDKRLAVEVEDHPLDYAGFEGTIPKGEYGGGSVLVWDRGAWTPEGDPHKGLKKGHLAFTLEGEKLHGRWHLVRLRGREGEKRTNWLLIKSEDDAARGPDDPDILEERPESVLTGRAIEAIGEAEPEKPARAGRKAAGSAPAGARRAATGEAAKWARSGADAADEAAEAPARGAKPAARAAAEGRTKAALGKDRLPDFVEPCLATLVAKPPRGDRWIHEIKLDGYRIEARLADGEVQLITRSGLDWTQKFGGAIVAAVKALPARQALLDGEIVVELESGASDFAALKEALSANDTARMVFYAFDLLHLDGEDLRPLPQLQRKQRLQALMRGAGRSGALRFSEHFEQDGELMLVHACRLSLEGIVSKLRNAPYRSGRGQSWLKSKCANRQEFVVIGYTPSTVSPRMIGSLALAVHDENGVLAYAGKVGTGFTQRSARELFALLDPLRVERAPPARKPPAAEVRDVRWVRPEQVAEVEFRSWTGSHYVRHASFRGLREDKAPDEVTVEEPAPTPEGKAGSGGAAKARARDAAEPARPAAKPRGRSEGKAVSRGAAARTEVARAGEVSASRGATAKPAAVPRSSVKLTHPDRIYWPDAGVTKQELVEHYATVWRWMAPHIVARPLALLRGPEGIGDTFFQKAAWKGMHRAVAVLKNPGTGGDEILAIQDFDGLAALVQGATLELHGWGSTVGDLEHPDRIVMDLDPGDGVSWEALKQAAFELRDRLDDLGLKSWPKTTGGKGLHVVVPLQPKADWDRVKGFAKELAEAMAADAPTRFLAKMTKSARTGRIFVDYLRNGRGATAILPFSTRARPGAPVAVPIAWDELGAADIRGAHYTVRTLPERLAALDGDPWQGFFAVKQSVPEGKSRVATPARRRA